MKLEEEIGGHVTGGFVSGGLEVRSVFQVIWLGENPGLLSLVLIVCTEYSQVSAGG